MIRLLFVRHGVTDLMRDTLCGRMPGVHLNAEGRRQARTLGRKLSSIRDLQAIYTSPLERTRETAEATALPHSLPVTIEEGLIELDYGTWTGEHIDSVRDSELWKAYNRFRSMSAAPGGESLLTVQERAWRCLSNLLRGHETGTVIVVSHGDVIRSLLLLFLGMPLDCLFRLEISPASVTSVSIGSGLAPVVHQTNQTFENEGS